ncbi:uncharacterized protein LOC127708201 [Mytilus californianus]|uniref:uncharacterized protein LOC127708201 n=1 Tax=Mytilus californianus TaxID=6549 RepID=UPI002245CF6D|nr:uncharacterized protein LOC127708201 [Mytilus californianus]
MSTFILRSGVLILSFGIASEIIYQIYKRVNIKNKGKRRKFPKTEVLFFPDETVACKSYFTDDYGCRNSNCRFSHEENSLSKLFTYLMSARTSIDICVFVITCSDLAELLIKSHKKGVVVRVVTDNEQVDVPGSQIWKLRKAGIPVRIDNSSFFMHHKFAIIDQEHLMNGSFNWTQKAITGNQENILITNNEDIVLPFISEFEKLWLKFDPNQN